VEQFGKNCAFKNVHLILALCCIASGSLVIYHLHPATSSYIGYK